MSYQAQNIFGLLYVGGVSRKAVLQACANYADDQLRVFAKTKTIAGDTDQSEATARRRLHELEDLGLITRLPQWIDDSGKINKENRGRRISDEIRLNPNVTQPQLDERGKVLGLRWRKENGDPDDGSDESGPPNLQGQNSVSPPNLQGPAPSNSDDLLGRPLHCGKGITSLESQKDDIDIAREPLISKAAQQLADDCVEALGFEAQHPPFNGLPYQTSIWLARGYDPPRIIAAFARFAGERPIKPLTYFMKVVETACTAPSSENSNGRTETTRDGFVGRINRADLRSAKERRYAQAWDNVTSALGVAGSDELGDGNQAHPPATRGLPESGGT